MAQDFSRSFYKSKAWQQTRKAYIDEVNGLCERCKAKGLYTPGYIVHHKVKLTPRNINDPDITLNWDNLEYLCTECHNDEHLPSKPTADGLMFDEEGRLMQR